MDIDVTIGNDVTMRAGASSSQGRIDQYELQRELGGGGFGCVYLAKDTVAGVEVAVKGLPPEVKHNKEELENIRANFALVSRLHHPNIAAARRKELEDLKKAGIIDEAEYAAEVKKLEGAEK